MPSPLIPAHTQAQHPWELSHCGSQGRWLIQGKGDVPQHYEAEAAVCDGDMAQ